MKTPKCGWLFDVDGVISDPYAKRVTHPQIINKIVSRLKKGEPVGLITGRSVAWLEERVLPLVESQGKEPLSSFFVSGEMGGVFGEYKNGKLKVTVDKKLRVPQKAREAIKKASEKFPEVMFYDSPKKTMCSVEVTDGVLQTEFKKFQPKLDKLLKEVLAKFRLEKNFELDSSRLATNISHKSSGKDLGTRRFLDWLKKKGISAQKYYAFGDSVSDSDMAKEVHEKGHDVEFVFVGEKVKIKNKYPFKVVFPKSLFSKGVVEFMAQFD